MSPAADPLLAPLNRLVGTWSTEATHPMVPGVVVRGTATVAWLEGERFLLIRATTDHPQFPDSLSVIGGAEHDTAGKEGRAAAPTRLELHYYDSRGVSRVYDASADDAAWRYWREGGFPQRFEGRFTDDDTIVGTSQLRGEDGAWKDDLAITYRRVRGA